MGTQKDNIQDMVSKGCASVGEKCGNSKLTNTEVMIIRDWWERGLINQSGLGRYFDVSAHAINCIVHRRTWKHI